MDEYIKRKEALAKMNYLFRTYAFSGILTKKMREKLRAIPAADVVEVVRCRDCKWFGLAGCAIQIVDDTDKPSEDDFCSFGERKGGDE